MARQDKEVTLESVGRTAVEKDVIINTIYCKWSGAMAHEVLGWQNLAKRAEGRFAQIDMKRGTLSIATPQDSKLVGQSAKLNTTYLAYGTQAVRREKLANQTEQDANAMHFHAGASRAVSKATGLYRNAEWDLVDRLKDDPKFDVTKLSEAQLCDEMKKMKPAERLAHIKKKLAQREALQKEIAELSKERADYIKQAQRKDGKKGDKAFDDAVRGALRQQARQKGFTIPD